MVEPCSPVTSLMFVFKGSLAVCEPSGEPFCILPEGNYFGDYQILNFVPYLFKVRAIDQNDFFTTAEVNHGRKSRVAVLDPAQYN